MTVFNADKSFVGQLDNMNFEAAPDGYIQITFNVPEHVRLGAGEYQITPPMPPVKNDEL